MLHQYSITPWPPLCLCTYISTMLHYSPAPSVSVYMHIYNDPSILYSPVPSVSLCMHIYNTPLLPRPLYVSVHAYLQWSINTPLLPLPLCVCTYLQCSITPPTPSVSLCISTMLHYFPDPSMSLYMHIYNAPSLLPRPPPSMSCTCISGPFYVSYLQYSINTPLLPGTLCVSVYMHIYNAPSMLHYFPDPLPLCLVHVYLAPSMSHIYNAPLLPGTLCVSVHAGPRVCYSWWAVRAEEGRGERTPSIYDMPWDMKWSKGCLYT